MWTIRRGRKEKLNLKEWDDGWDTDSEEGSWFSYVQDRADRGMLVQSERHTIQTKGFDLPLPSCVIEPVNLGDPWHFQRIRALSPFAVAHFNKKKGKNLVLVEIIKANYWEQRCSYLLTLRVVDSSTLEMKIYQTRIAMADFIDAEYPNKKRDHVEIFRPWPDNIGEPSLPVVFLCLDELDELRYQTAEECDTDDATYAACSVCDMGLYRLMVEHARKFKLRYTLCLGQIGLNHPFHRCRIPQSVMAALAYYKENQKLSLRFYEVSRAEVFDFGFNKIHYKINFHANNADPISKMELLALVVDDNAQHGEMIEVEDVKIISVTDLEDSLDSRGVKRKRLDELSYQTAEECDTGDATYAACSVCDTELYGLMVEHARKFKLKCTLCLGRLGLNHPFHRCRIRQSVKAALACYNQSQAISPLIFKSPLSFHKVGRAEVFDFGFNKIHYKIDFHANNADPISKMELQALVVYDNAQHGEMIEIGVEVIQSPLKNTANGVLEDNENFGIGFSSVFLVSSCPYILSNGYRVRFSEKPDQQCGIGYLVPEWVAAKPFASDIRCVYGSEIALPVNYPSSRAREGGSCERAIVSAAPRTSLFLSKIKGLYVRDSEPGCKAPDNVSIVSISSERHHLELREISAESYEFNFLLGESDAEENCEHYIWRQTFPVKPENRVHSRMEVEKWIVSLSFPLGKETEAISFNNRWNIGILESVPSAFENAFLSFLREEFHCPVHEAYKFVPVKPSTFPELNKVRQSITSGKFISILHYKWQVLS
ncbi:hypothetical protein Tsubulata_024890 [Turnera subulata]|uniref:Uncharacterized protein n=1 Tax=Turnera subulata TaxID=218843 RepID=A0A9Q0JMS9_9ROSI|nr:hypothetical protein Tsubulata_024890 [Turnera subulata]